MSRPSAPPRRTRLVATIGPATVGRMDELVAAGLDVARLNLSHGARNEHLTAAATVRAAGTAAGRDIGILVDLPGPKLRLGPLEAGAIELEVGTRVALAGGGDVLAGGDVFLPLQDAEVLSTLREGDRILLADGAAELRCVSEWHDGRVIAEVVHGGLVRSRAGVNVPADRFATEVVAAADDAQLALVADLAPDYVGQSFVRSAAEVTALRQRLPAGIRMVAKIETRPAVDAIESILGVADGIMIARGDLGVELPFESVPIVQKDLAAAALRAGRPSIVATQMLESMVDAPRPTRAEASDVANAILDGADAVMLSAETAIGSYPVEALRAAARIAVVTDQHASVPGLPGPDAARFEADRDARATTLAAVTMAHADPDVVALACFTRSGRTARLLSALRPSVGIRAFTASAEVARSLSLNRGVTATALSHAEAEEQLISDVILTQLRADQSMPPDAAVVLVRAGVGGGPNTLAILRL